MTTSELRSAVPRESAATSLRGRLLIAALRLKRAGRPFSSAEALRESIRKSQQPARDRPPAALGRRHRVTCREIHGRPVYTIRPRATGTSRHVLYLHGGAYVHQIQRDHWKFLSRLIDETGCTVTVRLYPLAPANHPRDTVAMVLAAHDAAFAGTASRDTVLMGDSAGGALALVLARALGAAGGVEPKEVVLISPWLDVTMTDPVARKLDPSDPYLGVAGLAEAGRLYAGGLDRTDPVISPLYAPAATPGELSLFIAPATSCSRTRAGSGSAVPPKASDSSITNSRGCSTRGRWRIFRRRAGCCVIWCASWIVRRRDDLSRPGTSLPGRSRGGIFVRRTECLSP